MDKTRILYIDDEELNLQLFEINFQEEYHVITGFSGEEGLSLLESNPDIKVVISDMRMPNMNGMEFIRIANEKFKGKVFFILTGYGITEEMEKSIESGLIKNYFMKPFKIQEIRDSIEDAI